MAGIGNRTCPHCGRVIGKDDEYCLHCGIKLVEGEDSLSKPLTEKIDQNVPFFLKARIGFTATRKVIFILGGLAFVLFSTLFFGIGAIQADMTGKIVLFTVGGLMIILGIIAGFVVSLLNGNKATKPSMRVYENHIEYLYKSIHVSLSFGNLLFAYALPNGLILHFVQDGNDPFVYLSFEAMDDKTKEFLMAKGYEVGMKGEKK